MSTLLYVAAHTNSSVLGRITRLTCLANVGLLTLGTSGNVAEHTVTIESREGAVATRT